MKVAFIGNYTLNDLVVADNGNQIVPVSILNFAGSTAGFGIGCQKKQIITRYFSQ